MLQQQFCYGAAWDDLCQSRHDLLSGGEACSPWFPVAPNTATSLVMISVIGMFYFPGCEVLDGVLLEYLNRYRECVLICNTCDAVCAAAFLIGHVSRAVLASL